MSEMTKGVRAAALDFLIAGNDAARASRYREASEQYSRGLELVPDSTGLFLNRASAFEEIGDFAAAFSDLEQYLAVANEQDSEHKQLALKRFIGLGIRLRRTHAVLMCLQRLERVPQWKSREFYEILIGLLAQESDAFELNLPYYLQRACEASCLSQRGLESALSLWELQHLAHQTSGQAFTAQDLLIQIAMLQSAPQFVLHLWLESLDKKALDHESLVTRSIEVLSLWVQVHPMDASATEHLIQFLLQKNQLDLAECLFLDLSRIQPNEPNYLLGLARARLFKRDLERAFIVINAALDLDESNLTIRLERAVIFEQLLSPHLALVDLNQNLQLDPQHVPTLIAKVNVLTDLGRLEEASSLITQLRAKDLTDDDRLSLDLAQSFMFRLNGNVEQWYRHTEYLAQHYPEKDSTFCELGWKEIHLGNWPKGFALLEHRFAPGMHYFPLQPHIDHARIVKWSPETFNASVSGKHLLLCGEEGMGDVVQFSRFIPLLFSKGVRITLVCKEALHPLFAFNFPEMRLVGPQALVQELGQSERQAYDFYGEIMSIPWVLQLNVTDLSGAPYLKALPQMIAQMGVIKQAHRAASTNPFSIGLRWVSSMARSGRSVPLEELEPLRALPIDIFGLHYGPLTEADKTRYAQWSNFYPTELNIEEVTGLMMNLDCVVTSDTVTAHLAGALGCPTILLKPSFIDWRWGSAGSDSIWYDSMQIIRQETFNDWGLSIAELCQTLHRRLQ